LNLCAVPAAFSRALDACDAYTRVHSIRVAELAGTVAARLRWSEERVQLVRLGGTLHDVGKVAVPATILSKPGPLTPAELAQVRAHPSVGVRLLAREEAARPALGCVLYHHERWDGGGYPTGLAGADIPVEARLLAIADAYDAMTSDRPYRPALAPEAALEEVDRCAGSQFDPELATAFLELWADAPIARGIAG